MATGTAADPHASAGRVLVVVSRYNESVTRKLLDGAWSVIRQEGLSDDRVDVIWVPGAFELPLAVTRGLDTGRYVVAVALGAVIRGETPHFEYVSEAATQGLTAAAMEHGVPVGFGLLTCNTLEQARARAGGDAGNKGEEAARSAFETLRALDTLDP